MGFFDIRALAAPGGPPSPCTSRFLETLNNTDVSALLGTHSVPTRYPEPATRSHRLYQAPTLGATLYLPPSLQGHVPGNQGPSLCPRPARATQARGAQPAPALGKLTRALGHSPLSVPRFRPTPTPHGTAYTLL